MPQRSSNAKATQGFRRLCRIFRMKQGIARLGIARLRSICWTLHTRTGNDPLTEALPLKPAVIPSPSCSVGAIRRGRHYRRPRFFHAPNIINAFGTMRVPRRLQNQIHQDESMEDLRWHEGKLKSKDPPKHDARTARFNAGARRPHRVPAAS
jgi:hypothetical protein